MSRRFALPRLVIGLAILAVLLAPDSFVAPSPRSLSAVPPPVGGQPELGVAYQVTWCNSVPFTLGDSVLGFALAPGQRPLGVRLEPNTIATPHPAGGVVILWSSTSGDFLPDEGGPRIPVVPADDAFLGGCL